jgi:tripartite-type tricarboxylate transporter receptor subunit TctC
VARYRLTAVLRWLTKAVALAAFASAISTIPTNDAAAQTYPDHVVKIVSPFAPGGSTDVVGRLIAQQLSIRLGQPVILESRPGAGGNIGARAVIRARPDGYTLLLATTGVLSINPTLYRNLDFSAPRDLVPISKLFDIGHVVVVNPGVPARNLQALIDLARKNPDKLTYASGGNGSSTHLFGELFKQTAKVSLRHIPYRGNGPAMNDVLAGNVQIMFDQNVSASQYVHAGTLRVLAVTTQERSKLLPDVPTTAEAGLPDFAGTSWGALMAPRGTPVEIVARLNREVIAILQDPNVRKAFDAIGADPGSSTPDELETLIDHDLQRWKKVIETAGIYLD